MYTEYILYGIYSIWNTIDLLN